jgi:hypothetical protein
LQQVKVSIKLEYARVIWSLWRSGGWKSIRCLTHLLHLWFRFVKRVE